MKFTLTIDCDNAAFYRPSLISERLLYEDGPENGPKVQTWEVIA